MDINKKRLLHTFLQMVRIDSETSDEQRIAQWIVAEFKKAGVRVRFDNAGPKVKSNARGNIIAFLPGRKPGPVIGLNAHIDTVVPGKGIRPVVTQNTVRSAGKTILGADDKAGAAIVIETIRAIKSGGLNHTPLYAILTISEEKGLLGARHIDLSKEKLDFILSLDSGDTPGRITVRAPYQNSIRVEIIGRAAHSGLHPEEGINALTAAAAAISRIKLGRIDAQTTANLGLIQGGSAVNIVPEHVIIQGEVRSHSETKLERVTHHVYQTFERICRRERTKLIFHIERVYDGFDLKGTSPVVRHIAGPMKAMGLTLDGVATGGGQDANIFNAAGIPAVNIGCGMKKPHTVDESLDLKEFYTAARLIQTIVLQ